MDDLFLEGIDVYFDNVGGDHLKAAIDSMREFGRIGCCGMISGYNDERMSTAPKNLSNVISKRLRMQGFIVSDHVSDRKEFQRIMVHWVEGKRITWDETISEGLHLAPAAFINLFTGNKTRKALVKLDSSGV